ncbi:MAG: redoxin domain-containing protein [Winogradskyella sp.]|uniref:TlpA family protein disulfide reductase n=1 Tax=Winogradskyella sp. TaxID=1883156 RepID=UPI00184DBB03|nr:thioredoxin-like domain-containing protein [Winogradskyella sp.]MBT8246094.1 redoxin domain-containing protein [Winogradskyella sp.]NNK23002.1 redoxin domain-containing protein [Winogradskyella sp.]
MKKLFIFLLLFPLLLLSQQKINGTFSPAEDFTYAFLYKATPDGANYVNRAKLDSLGNFSIALDENAKTGIYKIVYAIPPEENNFDLVFNGKEDVSFAFSMSDGVNFTESTENKLWASYLNSMDVVNQTISNYFTRGGKNKKAFNSIFKTLKETQTSYEGLAKGKLIEVFIKANSPYIPETFEDLASYSKNLKANFFNSVDFTDDLLRSSSLITDRVSGFVFGLSANTDNITYQNHVDIVAEAIKGTDAKIQSPVLEMLWQEFKRRENHGLANYISENFLLDIAKATENKILEQQLISYKNTSIGAIAPDFTIQNEPSLKLSELKGDKYYVLIFWSSVCEHCLKELPKVKNLMSTISNTKIVAYGLEKDAVNWSEEIKKYPDFVHGIGLGKWENPLVQTFAITATPTYFVLDANKKIIAKPYDFEGLEKFLSIEK